MPEPETHHRLRMSRLARLVVADLLAANAAHHPVQARRSLKLAPAAAEEYEQLRERYDYESTSFRR